MNPSELASKLKTVCGEKLEAVVLYGSAADGEFHKGHSDYNLAIVLKNLAPVELARCSPLIKKWTGLGNPLPIFLTREIISEAADVFPIEFSDIKEKHKVLYGTDCLDEIKIDMKNLRHQCEHEIRSKLLNLTSRFAVLAGNPKDLLKLILESSSSFFAIFRGILRLAGKEPAALKKATVEQLTQFVDFDASIFMEILDVREGTHVWKKEEALEKFEQYLTSLNAVVRYVDKI